MATSKTRTRVGSKKDPRCGDYARAVSGRVVFYSPSSASAYTGCNRFWWYTKIMGQKEPPSPALEYGNAVHHVLETYLETGNIVVPGLYKGDRGDDIEVTEEHIRRSLTSLDHLPRPGQGHVEQWADRVPVYDGPEGLMLFAGKIDWHGIFGDPWLPTIKGLPDFFDGYHILDHKTKANEYGKYGIPSPEQLARDRQGQLYAYVVTQGTEYQGTDVVFSHNYIIKRGEPRSVRVDTIMRAHDIQETWEAQADIARGMLLHAKAESAEDVPHNTNYCNAYNRECPFKKICPAWQSDNRIFDALSAFDTANLPNDEDDNMTGTNFFDLLEDDLGAVVVDDGIDKNLRKLGYDNDQIGRMTDSTKAHIASENIESKGVSISRDGQLKVIATQPTEPVDTTPATTGDAAPAAQLPVQPDDAHPHDNDDLSPSAVREAADVVARAYQQQVDAGANPRWSLITVGAIAQREGLDRGWALNLAALSGIDIIESDALQEFVAGFTEDQILSVPATSLTASTADGTDQDRAKALVAAPVAAFRDLAAASPRSVLLAARGIADAKRRQIIDELLDDGRLATPFDAFVEERAGERAALRALWVESQSGVEITEDLIDQTLKAKGVYRRRNKKTIERLAEILGGASPVDQPEEVAPLAPTKQADQDDLIVADLLGTRTLEDLFDLLGGYAKVSKTSLQEHLQGLLTVHSATQGPGPSVRTEALQARVAELEEQLAAAPAPQAAPSVAPQGLTIYAGCRVISRHEVAHISELLAPIEEAATKKVRLLPNHERCDHWTLADYGKGKTIMAHEIRNYITNHGLPEGSYYYPRNTIYDSLPLVELFEAAGAQVIVGAYG